MANAEEYHKSQHLKYSNSGPSTLRNVPQSGSTVSWGASPTTSFCHTAVRQLDVSTTSSLQCCFSATASRGPIWGTSPTVTSQRSKCMSSDPWGQPYSDITIAKYGYIETSLNRNPGDNTLDFGTLFTHRPGWISNRSWKPKLDPLGP